MARKGKPWTAEDDHRLRNAAFAGSSLSALSNLLGRSPSSIRSRAYVLRVSLHPARVTTSAPSERLLEMRQSLSARVTGLRPKRQALKTAGS